MKHILNLCGNKHVYQYLATLTGSFAVLTSGINLGWTSPYLPAMLDGTNPEISMTSDEGLWCAVMPLVGAPVGAFLTAAFVDKIGRKNVTLAMAPITFLMFVLLAYSRTTFLICLARFIIGSVEGGLYTSLPMYLGEISTPSLRGTLTASISLATILGTLFINILGFNYTIYASSLICALVPLIHGLTFMWMPESPYYFLKKKRYEDARKSLETLRGTSEVEEELKSLSEAVARQEADKKVKLTDLFTVKSNQRAVLIFIILNLTKKFSGKNPFLFYTTTIFQSAGGSLDLKLSVIIYISVEAITTVFAFFIVYRVGRRPIILVSTIGCAFALATIGAYFFLKDEDASMVANLGWLPITALTAYNVCYSLGLEMAPTIFLGELFPTNIKAVALGMADTFSVMSGTVASKLFQITKDSQGMFLPFWIFSGCCALGVVFIAKYIPETKNKTLEEIQLYLIKETAKANP